MWEGQDHKSQGFVTEHGFTLTRVKLVRKLTKTVRKMAVFRSFGPFQTGRFQRGCPSSTGHFSIPGASSEIHPPLSPHFGAHRPATAGGRIRF
jgi:hypothetical protein